MSRPRGSRSYGFERRSTPQPTRSPSSTDIAWAAGFLEGEGSFNAKGNSQRVVAVQVDREPIDRLQSMFGGIVTQRQPKPPHRLQFFWTVNGAKARGVMMTTYLFLSEFRRGQVREALRSKI